MHTCKNTHVFVVSTRVYRLIFTKHSANIEPLVDFINYNIFKLRRLAQGVLLWHRPIFGEC